MPNDDPPGDADAAQDVSSTPPEAAAEDYSKYEIDSRTEILHILRVLATTGALVTAYFHEGRDFLLTSLLGVADAEGMLALETGASEEMNRQALAAPKLVCVSHQGKVRIHFTVVGLRRGNFEGRQAFFCPLPLSLARVQRREYYRLATPVNNPPVCLIPIAASADGPARILRATIMDLSGGGMAVMVPPDDRHFEPDAEFRNCRIDLPDIGSIIADLRVHSLHQVTLPSGKSFKRSGCQFLKLPAAMESIIQRYIFKVERERKQRAQGLA